MKIIVSSSIVIKTTAFTISPFSVMIMTLVLMTDVIAMLDVLTLK